MHGFTCTTLVVLLFACLTACGGGGGGGSSTGSGNSASSQTSAIPGSTLSSYAASIASSSTSSIASSASSELSSFVQATNALLAAQIYQSINWTPRAGAPAAHTAAAFAPLTFGTLDLLRGASSGTTASKFAGFEAALGEQSRWSTLLQTAQGLDTHQRALVALNGTRFAKDFLDRSHQIPVWSGTETSFDSAPDTRLQVTDTANIALPLSGATTFTGVFRDWSNSPYAASMLAITSNVKQLAGSDYLANKLSIPGSKFSIVTVQPVGTSVDAYSSSRLQAIVAEIAQSMYPDSALPTGTIYLPVGSLSLENEIAQLIRSTGAGEVFSEVDANLYALDLRGGTYASLQSDPVSINFGPGSVNITSSSISTYTYSALNLHDTGSSGSSGSGSKIISGGVAIGTPIVSVACPASTVSLKPFLIMIVNSSTRMVVSLNYLPSMPDMMPASCR